MENYLKLFKNEEEYNNQTIKPHFAHLIDESELIDVCSKFDYVDLDLPSGTLWANKNLGACTEIDYGNYYQYGKGTKTYEQTSGETYYNGSESPLDLSKDAARQLLGGQWHIPTIYQIRELSDNTLRRWVTNYNNTGIDGVKFMSTKNNSKFIFIPNGGDYYNYNFVSSGWSTIMSSTPEGFRSVRYYSWGSNSASDTYNNRAGLGLNIRPVIGDIP